MARGRQARRGDRDEARPELLFLRRRRLFGVGFFRRRVSSFFSIFSTSSTSSSAPNQLHVLRPLPRRHPDPGDDARGAVQGATARVVGERDGEAGLADGEGEARREVEVERVSASAAASGRGRRSGGALTPTKSTIASPPRCSLDQASRDLNSRR